jgi:glycosyltransferase involved in cell wall biosynthesis
VPEGDLLRIVFVAWRELANVDAGGSEVLVHELASGLTKRGHEVTLVCAGPVGQREYEVRPNGGRLTQYLRAPFLYYRHLRNADLVVDVANGVSFLVPLWRRGPSVCFVNHVHDDQWEQWFPAPVARFGRFLEEKAMPSVYRRRLFVTVSPSTAGELRQLGVDESRIRLVYNGVHVPATLPPKSDEPSFLAVGRFVPHKRFDLLVDLWAKVHPHVGGRLTIIGDGMLREGLLQRRIPGLDLPGRVSEEDKARLYAEAWALVHPASVEGWGIVITEAAAARTPAIGFRVPGVRDSIVDGRTGYLCDSEDDFVRRWIELAQNPATRAALGDAARGRAREFSWANTVNRFDAIASEAVSGRSPHRATQRNVGPPMRAAADGPDVTVIVPAYNEAGRLPETLPRLVERLTSMRTELLVVDDASDDGTSDVARSILSGVDWGHVVRLDRHRGKGAAVRAGVARASGERVCFMDADLATDLDDLPRLLAALDTSHVAIGSRAAAGSSVSDASLVRVAVGRTYNALVRATTGVPWRDTQCGFKAFRAPVAKVLFGLSAEDGFAFDLEVLLLAQRVGYRISEVPVHWHAVPGSHLTLSDPVWMAMSAVRLASRTRADRTVESLRVWSANGRRTVSDLVGALRRQLHRTTPIVPYKEGALALLPFHDSDSSRTLADDLRARLVDVEVEPAVVAAGELLFGPTGSELRAALVST